MLPTKAIRRKVADRPGRARGMLAGGESAQPQTLKKKAVRRGKISAKRPEKRGEDSETKKKREKIKKSEASGMGHLVTLI